MLTFKTAPDYENPTDADTNNAYQVTVTASDGTLSDSIAITISVTNVNEAPAFSSDTLSLTVSENAAAGTVVGTLTVTDPDAGDSLSYTFTSSDTFTVDGSGQIKVADGASLDYETKSAYAVTVTASDLGGLTDTVTVNITVTDVAEPPLAPTNLAVAAQGATILRATWDRAGQHRPPGHHGLRRAVPAGHERRVERRAPGRDRADRRRRQPDAQHRLPSARAGRQRRRRQRVDGCPWRRPPRL